VADIATQFERSIVQQADGRWGYRLVPADGDPAKWESDGHRYTTRTRIDTRSGLTCEGVVHGAIEANGLRRANVAWK
jgi:hypothetical protein